MDNLFLDHTPIEEYRVDRKTIFVKREDLFGKWPAPPLAKLRGLRVLVERIHKEGFRLIGCWDTRISKIGQGLAACCQKYPDLSCVVAYPAKGGEAEPEVILMAAELGAEIYTTPNFPISFCYARVKKYVTDRGGVMLPFGLECPEAVEGVRQEARTVPVELLEHGTLVTCCGSGTTLAGLISGLPILPSRIVGVACGRSPNFIRACVKVYAKCIPPSLQLDQSSVPYFKALAFPCPFPSHPNYDLKAWKFLVENVQRFQEPILFWNIGA